MIRHLLVGKDTELHLARCDLCGHLALCFKFKKRRADKGKRRWSKVYACTQCVPIREELKFGEHLVVMKRERLNALLTALEFVSRALVKMEILCYTQMMAQRQHKTSDKRKTKK